MTYALLVLYQFSPFSYVLDLSSISSRPLLLSLEDFFFYLLYVLFLSVLGPFSISTMTYFPISSRAYYCDVFCIFYGFCLWHKSSKHIFNKSFEALTTEYWPPFHVPSFERQLSLVSLILLISFCCISSLKCTICSSEKKTLHMIFIYVSMNYSAKKTD